MTSSQRAFRALHELGLAAYVGVTKSNDLTEAKLYDVPDWAAAAVRAPRGNLGLQGWRVLLRALLDDEELRAAVEAADALAGFAAAEELMRARVPAAFAWLDAWEADGRVLPAGGIP
jgi:hypothetical protein